MTLLSLFRNEVRSNFQGPWRIEVRRSSLNASPYALNGNETR
jgi:hypothetical protein